MKKPPPELAEDAAALPSADEALGHRIKAAREARELSQQGVATRSKWADPDGKGISRTALIGYEGGSSRPGARELRLLCQTLMVSPNKLLFGSELPFQTAHTAIEGLRADSGQELKQAVETALILAALKGHERDALMSLALSLAGRQLGDLRLSGLRMMGALILPEIEATLREGLAPGADPASMSLEDMAGATSRHAGSNLGNDLRIEDGEVVGGVSLYPDPEARANKS